MNLKFAEDHSQGLKGYPLHSSYKNKWGTKCVHKLLSRRCQQSAVRWRKSVKMEPTGTPVSGV